MTVKFDFEDINLIAKKGIVKSRKECNTSVNLNGFTFKVPIIPGNMSAVIDEKLCVWLAKNNYFYVMHRFDIDQVKFVKMMHEQGLYASISIGVKNEDRILLAELKQLNMIPEFITIDIAHGHSNAMEEMIKFINNTFAKTKTKPFIIAGNVMTKEAVKDLEKWGTDAIKFGVGPGKACITKLKTGFGTGGWQLNALQDVASTATKPLIADGGIRCNGDIAKAIAFGATMIMAGSILAGYDESPGKIIKENGNEYKEYFGSASIFNKVEATNIEGKKILVPYKGSIAATYKEIEEDLQSAISYAGGKELSDLTKCDYVIVKGTINNGDDR
ncbi:GMP reductase [Spiroplasma endosymbiont of Virgichneumon dumeticola]|uniref:GMP reductase n=1 Tax=Spiroplasma endosymbiont of Virgichneumon dumeticola TaxID=3139323 RepID=UPI0035C89FA1